MISDNELNELFRKTKKELIKWFIENRNNFNDQELYDLLDKLYMNIRQIGYDDGYCDGIGEGCDYNGRMYDEIAFEWNEEEDEPGERIDYDWDLK